LHTITTLPIPFQPYYPDENEPQILYFDSEIDEKETEDCMQALVAMVEARAALGGTCVGLKKLDGDWLSDGRPDLVARVLHATLPTLEELPEHDKLSEEAMRTFVDEEAPRLKELELKDMRLLREIAGKALTFKGLRTLRISICGESVDADIHVLASALSRGICWPYLECLDMSLMNLGSGERFHVILHALLERKQHVGKGLCELLLHWTELTDADISGPLVDAFRAGIFSELKTLSLVHHKEIGDEGAIALAAVLGRAPCLTSLELHDTKIEGRGCGAIAYAVTSVCPALRRLVLPSLGRVAEQLVEEIISAMNRAERRDKEKKCMLSSAECAT
jgi:hypothetical protein